MKRDFNLIHQILRDIEKLPACDWTETLEYPEYDANTVCEHVRLLIEAKLIRGKITICPEAESYFHIDGLTWDGHDFLDVLAKDDLLWTKAQDTILKPGLGITFDLLFEWLKIQAGSAIGLP